MRAVRSSTRVFQVLALYCAGAFGGFGCGDSGSQPVVQTEDQKAKQAAADKATADAFKESQKKSPKR